MTLQQLQQKVLDLVAEDDIEAAIDAIEQWAHDHNQQLLKRDLALLKNERTVLLREKTMGLLTNQDAGIRQNIWNNKLLDLLDAQQPTASATESLLALSADRSPVSIFVSYSKKDAAYLDGFKKSVKPLVRNGSITVWDDTQLLPGDIWDHAIKHQLQTADMIVFLVSADLINTDYVWDIEMDLAFARHQKGAVRIVPIILRGCGWKDTAFAQFNALPDQGKPIQSYPDTDDVWSKVYEELKKLLGQ